MKILVVTPHYYPESFSITSLCELWAKQGHEVLVVTDKPNYGFGRILPEYKHVKDEVVNGVRIHRCKSFARKDSRLSIIFNYLSFWRSSVSYLKHLKEDFDVVYSMSLSPVISVSGANVYAKKHHVPHLLHCLDLWPESTVVTGAIKKGSLSYKILYRWSRSIYKKTDGVLVSSPSFVSYFREALKLPDLPIDYVPQPPYLASQAGEDIVYDHTYNLVYAGNIGKLQLVENLVEAASLLPKDKDIVLHIIGMGSKAEEVKKKIEEAHLESRVIFHGRLPRAETTRYYARCTAIVVSLTSAGTVGKTIPSKLVSSLPYAKPILAVLGGDGKEVLLEAGGGVFSKDETPEAIEQAMEEVCHLPEEERKELGAKNKAYFDSHFQLEVISQEILDRLAKARKN